MNNMHSFFSSLCHSLIPLRATVMLAGLLALAWSSLALCDEIHDAAQSGDLAKVKVLLKDKPDLVFSKNENGVTPLFLAAFYGHKDVVDLLIVNKAEINAKTNEGGTPLHAAALKGHKDVAELLIVNKAEVNAKDIHSVTPLHMAALGGHKDVAELLRQHGGHE